MIVWILVSSYVISVVGYFIYLLFFPPIKKEKPSLLLSDYMEMKITYCDICLCNIAKNIGESPVCYNSIDCVYWNKDITERCLQPQKKGLGDEEEKEFWKYFGEDNTE